MNLKGGRPQSHGHCPKSGASPEYQSWSAMMARCLNPKHRAYNRYGGRGIKVCERWLKFENFFADMGVRPDELTLDRENSDGDYEPENCKWSTITEQNNNKRTNRILTAGGDSKTVSEWAREKGVSVSSLRSRLNLGWSDHDTLTKPFNLKFASKKAKVK